MSKIDFRYIYAIFAVFALLISLQSCNNEPSDNNPYLNEQGVFDFMGESDIDDGKELPDNIDPEKVLCFGKGLRVGRCISKTLESGICVGLIKNQKHVIAIEIPCETVTQDSVHVEQKILTE